MSRRPAPTTVLGDRDGALLRDVGRLRFLSGDHLARLHFASGTAVGRQRRAQAALRRLTDDGFLTRLPRRIGGPGSGSARFVYQLGYRGQAVVQPGRRARTPDQTGWLFVEHAVVVAEVVVELVEAERDRVCQDVQVQPEPEVWRHYVGRSARAVVLKPDLGLSLRAGSGLLVWFVEIDRATEGLRRIRAKAGQYLDYWRTGIEQQRPGMEGVFPRVLWSVPDNARATAICRTLADLPDPAGAMFMVRTKTDTARALLGQPTNQRGGEI